LTLDSGPDSIRDAAVSDNDVARAAEFYLLPDTLDGFRERPARQGLNPTSDAAGIHRFGQAVALRVSAAVGVASLP
jgi:hypothetical protein